MNKLVSRSCKQYILSITPHANTRLLGHGGSSSGKVNVNVNIQSMQRPLAVTGRTEVPRPPPPPPRMALHDYKSP